MTFIVDRLAASWLTRKDLDYHILRAAMVIIFFFFGYQKWWAYEAQRLVPYISNGPLIFWLYPVFGVRGASWFLGCSEWTFGALLFLGFWNKKLGLLRGSRFLRHIRRYRHYHSVYARWLGCVCRRLPAMTGNVPFLMKDVALLAASLYLMKQDVVRVARSAQEQREANAVVLGH
jgi:uncharacterized membrane protein YkgB